MSENRPKSKKTKARNYFLFFFSGLNPDEPCIFPFNYFGFTYTKCAEKWNDIDGLTVVEVNLQN